MKITIIFSKQNADNCKDYNPRRDIGTVNHLFPPASCSHTAQSYLSILTQLLPFGRLATMPDQAHGLRALADIARHELEELPRSSVKTPASVHAHSTTPYSDRYTAYQQEQTSVRTDSVAAEIKHIHLGTDRRETLERPSEPVSARQTRRTSRLARTCQASPHPARSCQRRRCDSPLSHQRRNTR